MSVESRVPLLFYLALNLSTNDNVIIFCSLSQICGIRTFFFSLGIFLSYHVAQYLKQCEHQMPVHLFFSSHFAPHVSIYSCFLEMYILKTRVCEKKNNQTSCGLHCNDFLISVLVK